MFVSNIVLPDMETTSFTKNMERNIRKALKAEREHGESQLR